MNDTFPLVSVVTVNYRQPRLTCEMLESIRKFPYPRLEVIVVDNGATDDQKANFEKAYPGAEVIVSQKNLGFAGGNNLGLRQATGDYLLLVNNDTEWTEGFVENLVKRFQSPGIGIVSPKIRYFDQPNVIQYAGFTKVHPLTGRNSTIGKNEVDTGQWDEARETAYAHGAAMMLSRKAIEKAGYMREDYFLYYEELDWCTRIRNAGFTIWYEPKSLIYHKESASTGRNSPLKTFYLTRNRFWFMKRHHSTINYLGFCTYFLIIATPIQSVKFILKREWSLLRSFYKGIFSGI